MQATREKTSFLAVFEQFNRHSSDLPEFVASLRRSGIERFSELGLPTTRQEDWRFTSVAPIAGTEFVLASGAVLDEQSLAPFSFPGTSRLVFVNGRFSPESSRLGQLPRGVVLGSLANAIVNHSELVERHLGRYATIEDRPFAALNTAFIADGAFVYIPDEALIEEPIHLLFVSTGGETPAASYPRNLIISGSNSQATVIESYAGLSEGYFTCPVTEIAAGANSFIDHYKLQLEDTAAFHIAAMAAGLGEDSNFSSASISLGGGLVRHDIDAILDGQGIDCSLNGLYMAGGDQHVDTHMRVDHRKPHCTSRELYKGVLDGRAHGVFNGRILVRKDAQKTDARQTNRNLLLSARSLVNTIPQLEILADDVKCTHGSTVGELDRDALFYLRSRGIGEQEARAILTFAFASDIIQRIKPEAVRARLENGLFDRLPGAEFQG